jgi:hypothetical protein
MPELAIRGAKLHLLKLETGVLGACSTPKSAATFRVHAIHLGGVNIGREKLGVRIGGSINLGEGQGHAVRGRIDTEQGVVDIELDQLLKEWLVGKAMRLTPRVGVVIRAVAQVV